MANSNIRYYDFGEFRLDVESHKLFRNNKPVPLTEKTFEILLFLVRNPGSLLTKQQFFENVWSGSYVEDTNLTQHIYRIRKIFGDSGGAMPIIETVPKLGYRFNADIETVLIDITDSDSAETELEQTGLQNKADSQRSGETASTAGDDVTPDTDENLQTEPEKADSIFRIKKNRKLVASATAAILIIGILAVYFFFGSEPNQETNWTHITVLPFTQIGESQDEKLRLGIADTIISKLGNTEGVIVSPTTSILPYFDKPVEDIFEIGEKLDADYVVTGTIQKENNTTRVNLQFYHIKNRRQICSAKFDQKYSDTFSLQDVVSEKAAEKLVEEIMRHKPRDGGN